MFINKLKTMKKILILSLFFLIGNTIVRAQAGAALNFDGVNDYVNLGNPSALDITGDITVETWINPDAAASGAFFFNGGAFGFPGYGFALFGTTLRVELSTGSVTVQVNNTVSINSAWHHVAFTRKQSTGAVLMFLDGVQLPSTGTFTNNLGVFSGNGTIGAYIGGSGAFFEGSMDETRVWSRALCETEIQHNMNCEIPTNSTGLVANYHYNQGTAGGSNAGLNTLTNSTSSSVNGILTNMALNGATSNWIAPGAVSGSSCGTFTAPTVTVSAVNQTNLNCYGETNGSASVSASGGSNLVYDWTPGTPTGDGTASVTDLAANIYTCSVTNSCGGTGSKIFTITQPAEIVNYGVTAATTSFCGNGSTTITTIGGSTVGINYYLRNGSTVVAGPLAGTGSPLVFNTGTINATTTYNVFAEKPGSTSLNFDGTANKYVDPNVLSPLANNFTIEAWINPTATHEIDAQSTGGAGGAGGQNYVLWPTWRNPSGAGVGISAGTNGVSVYEHSSGHMPALLVWTGTVTGWTHIAVVMTNKTPTLYVNGVLVATGVTSGRANCFLSLGAGAAQFPGQFGGIGGGSYGGFKGSIDEFRVYNTPLNATQISGNMNACLVGNEANLYAAYNFNEGTGTLADDLSPNNFNGTLTNMASTDWVVGTPICGTSCSFQMTQTATVTINSNPTANSSAGTIACAGGTANVVVSATGGTAPYTGIGTFPQYSGSIGYIVTDANGCTSTANVTITEPTQLYASSSAPSIACYGGTTTVTVNANGGTAPLSGAGSFTVSAGTHYYTVTDANGCASYTDVTIGEPSAPLLASSTSTLIACNGGTSSVVVSGNGGTAPYSGTGTFAELEGTFSYTVTDLFGCISTTNITITEPTELLSSNTATSIACNGGTSDVLVSATGGTAPYSGDGTFTELEGTYSYTITDANGCLSATDVTINEPTELLTSNSVTSIACAGGTSDVLVAATGGTTPYSGDGMFTEFAGTYSYNVTDANGCMSTTNVTITEPSGLSFSASSSPILCNGESTDVLVTVSGGTAPYTGAGTFPQFVGTQTYVITDANGCVISDSLTLAEPTLLVASSPVTALACFGNTAEVEVTATGGTTPYFGTQIFNVNSGVQNFTVTDGNGCTSSTTTTVTESAQINNGTTTNVLTISSLENNATYQWINCANNSIIAGETNQSYTATANGSYAVIVTNADGCSDTSICQVINNVGINEQTFINVSVYPNPTNNEVTIEMTETFAQVDVINVNGDLLSSTEIENGGKVSLLDYSAGIYFLKITTQNGSSTERIIKR